MPALGFSCPVVVVVGGGYATGGEGAAFLAAPTGLAGSFDFRAACVTGAGLVGVCLIAVCLVVVCLPGIGCAGKGWAVLGAAFVLALNFASFFAGAAGTGWVTYFS